MAIGSILWSAAQKIRKNAKAAATKSLRRDARRFLSIRKIHPATLMVLLMAMIAPAARSQTAHAGGGFFLGTNSWNHPSGIAADVHGNVFAADTNHGDIYEFSAFYGQIYPFPGPFPQQEGVSLPNPPYGVAVDSSGDLLFTTYTDVSVNPNNAVSEIAAVNGRLPASLSLDVLTLGSGFNEPVGMAVDPNGNVFVLQNTFAPVTEILAVNGTIPSLNPTMLQVGPSFFRATGIALDSHGNIFVADTQSDQVVELLAVNGTVPATNPTMRVLGSGFVAPTAVTVDADGNVFVAGGTNGAIYEMLAVNGTIPSSNPTILTIASGLGFPEGVAVDPNGNVFFTDSGYNRVTEMSAGALKSQDAYVGFFTDIEEIIFTFDSGGALASTPYVVLSQGAHELDFKSSLILGLPPISQCVAGHIYNAGDTCSLFVNFTPSRPGQRMGAVQLMGSAGLPIATFNLTGNGIGPMVTFPSNQPVSLPTGAGFNSPNGVAVDGNGNVYVADTSNNAVKEIVAVNGVLSAASSVIQLPGGYSNPQGVAVDGSGNVYVADAANNAVKEIMAVNGAVSAGSSVIQLPGGASGFNHPQGVALDGRGNVYVADTDNNAVKAVKPVNGPVPTVFNVIELPGGFDHPQGVALDVNGNVYVADTSNSAVKEIVAVNGAVSTSSSVIELPGSGSSFNRPEGVAVDPGGNVYVADAGNDAVKQIVAVNGGVSTTSSVITVPSGSGFNHPSGVAVDGSGNVFVADAGNNVVKELPYATPPSLIFATTAAGSTSTDSPQTVTVSNDGTAPLAFVLPGAGANPAFSTSSFSLANGSATTCPQLTSSSTGSAATLAAGASCTYGFAFSPQVVGSLSDSAVLSDNSLNQGTAMQSISLSGVATGSTIPSASASTITVNPSTLVMGTNATVTVHVSNGVSGIQGTSVALSATPGATVTYPSGSSGVSDVNGNVILSVTDSTAETVHLFSTQTGTQYASVTFVEPSYLVTTLTDDTNGIAGNCVALATDNSGGNAACSLRDAIAATNALPAGVTGTINFAASLSIGATPDSPALYALSAYKGGGTLTITGPSNTVINGPTSGASANLAINGGLTVGALTVSSSGATTLNNLIFSNGFNANGGGGIHSDGVGQLTVSNSTFYTNISQAGGAMYVSGGTVTVSNSSFAGNGDNAVGTDGGAIFVSGATMTVSNSTLSGNYLGQGGAAHGGGIYVRGGTLHVSNSTFGNNGGFGYGGGLYVEGATVTLSNVTLSGNTVEAGDGAGMYVAGGTVNLYNTLVPDALYGYTVPTGQGNVTSGANLSALGAYPGLTQTFLPLPGSAAICAGLATIPGVTIPSTDQRGATHSPAYCPAGSIDAGAVQTSYSLGTAFTTQPPSIAPSGVVLSPNPAVTVMENGVGFGGATVTMSAASGTVGGTTSATSAATTGLATFTNLTVTGAQAGDDLIATLSLNAAATPAAALTLTSTTFGSLTLSAPGILTGQAGVAYSQSVTLSNGTAPYTYTVTAGALPGGLLLNPSTGAITGTPTAVGSFPVTVQASDANHLTASTSFTLTTSAPSVTVSSPSLNLNLTVGTPVSVQFQGAGGTPAYSYTGANLPPGLTLSTGGLLSGTPTTAASYNFSVTVTDSTTGTGAPFSVVHSYSGGASKGVAAVMFTTATLTQTYNSMPLSAAVATTPAGLAVTYRYASASPTPNTVGASVASYSAGSTPPTNAGTYTVTATINDGNYTGSSVAQFTITQAPAVVTPSPASKVYGTTDPTLTGILSGFLARDGVTAKYTRTAGETVGGSPYSVSATLCPTAVLANYTVTYKTAQFTISKAAASVTPSAASKVYGTTDPTLTGTLSGFLARDGVAAKYTRIAGETVGGSPYSISATLTPAAVLANYTVTYKTAEFSITKATPTITKAPIAAAIRYGQTLASATLSGGMSSIPGGFAWTTLTTAPSAGTRSYPVTFSPSDAADYNTATTNVSVTVNPITPTVTFTVANHIYGNAPFTVSSTSPSTGAITYSVVSGPATVSGSTVTLTGEGTVVLIATQAAAGNYLAGSAQATFTVATPVTLKLSSDTITYPLTPSVVIAIGLNNRLVPTGTATVYDGSKAVGKYPVLAVGGGEALGLILPPLAVGKHVLTAVYSGDKNFPPGTSAPVTLTVTSGR